MSNVSQGIQSLRRGLKALEATIESDVRPAELAAMLQVGRTTAFRLLKTLVIEGYVEQDPLTKTFQASPSKIFSLASRLSSSLQWLNMAQGFLKELADATGETANLATLNGPTMVYVAQQIGAHEFSVRPLLGAKRPIHVSAVGKAAIAFLDEDELNGLIAEAGLTPLTSHSITSPEVLRSQLAEVRARGYAVDDQETIDGVRCIAAPIMNPASGPFAAIGISGPVVRLTDSRIPELGKTVRGVAERLSNSLGAIELVRAGMMKEVM